MTSYNKMIIGLAVIFLFVVGCQSSSIEPISSTESQSGQILSSVPSLAELAGTPAPEFQPLPTLDADEVEKGREVYAENCAECHGEKLEGESDWQQQNEDGSFRSPPHDSSGHTWHHGDESLLDAIEFGGARLTDNIGGFSNMPVLSETLSEAEIAAVLTFIKSTWPVDIRQTQWEQTLLERSR